MKEHREKERKKIESELEKLSESEPLHMSEQTSMQLKILIPKFPEKPIDKYFLNLRK